MTAAQSWAAWATTYATMALAWLRHTPAARALRRWLDAGDEATQPDWTITRAVAFYRDGTHDDVVVGPDPAAFLRCMLGQAASVDAIDGDEADWRPERLELRYVAGGRKFRVVLRPGVDPVVPWPPYESARAACRLPRGVLAARLCGDDDACHEHVDVTPRVRKYQGPRGDFHAGLGLAGVRVRDLFPFDDHESNARRFGHIVIVDTLARHARYAYGSDDALGAAAAASAQRSGMNGSVASPPSCPCPCPPPDSPPPPPPPPPQDDA